jgi:hypothetical protein
MSETEIEIVWREPPPKVSRSKWADLLAPLKERPGAWAMIRTDTPERVSGLRTRLSKTSAVKGQFELRAHKVSDQVAELYVRFMPPETAA